MAFPREAITLVQSPCKGCCERALACHGSCEKYAAFRVKCEALAVHSIPCNVCQVVACLMKMEV